MNKYLEILSNKKLYGENKVGTSRNKQIDPNGLFYHVIQQTDNRSSLFSADAARHRDYLIKVACQQMGIEPIINVVMPNHTHDVFLTNDVTKIRTLFRNVNRGTSVFIRRERAKKFNQNIQKVFSSSLGFVVIKDRKQFFELIKYLYDNPAYLKEEGEFVPYSCFDLWERNYFKPYNVRIFEDVFDLSIKDILEMCKSMDKRQIRAFAEEHFNDSQKQSDELFKINPNVPWIV